MAATAKSVRGQRVTKRLVDKICESTGFQSDVVHSVLLAFSVALKEMFCESTKRIRVGIFYFSSKLCIGKKQYDVTKGKMRVSNPFLTIRINCNWQDRGFLKGVIPKNAIPEYNRMMQKIEAQRMILDAEEKAKEKKEDNDING